MLRWMWGLVAVVGLGLAACRDGGGAVEVERGRLGEEPVVEQEAPLESEGVLGGEDLAEQEFRGTVTAVGRTQFIVRDQEGVERPFEIDDETNFVRRGQPVGREQLQEGKQIRTTYDEREGEWVADEVEVY